MTLVSIVTPSFNQAAFLGQAMHSVLEQDYGAIEYMVVDGGSTDGSAEIIRQHADRLAWWTSEPDAGQAEAVNKGFTRARGEILGWLNSDDFYLAGAVSAAVRALTAKPRAVLVYGNLQVVDEHNRLINSLHYRPSTLESLLCFRIIGQPAVFMRRSAFEAAGGLDTRLHFLLDHQLWIKMARQGLLQHVDETWAAARHHADAKNRSGAGQFGREAFQILDWVSQNPDLAAMLRPIARRARASAHRVDARYLLDGGQPSAALSAWMRALRTHPPTALSRLNLLGSALLEVLGLGALRKAVLHARKSRLDD